MLVSHVHHGGCCWESGASGLWDDLDPLIAMIGRLSRRKEILHLNQVHDHMLIA